MLCRASDDLTYGARAEGARRECKVRASGRSVAKRDQFTPPRPATKLYYLNIDLDGSKRTDCTADLVFPLMFGVADDETAARIVSRLSSEEFWTSAGIRTVPRTAVNYEPTHGYGLLGGVWVGVSFWYAFAAARFNPAFMAHSLGSSFQHYSNDPRRNNTVPGQFSEWLHGETLVNQGMMLSPWFPPRYLWAAIEGAAGFDVSEGVPSVNPRLAPDWQWMGVQNLPLGEAASYLVCRAAFLNFGSTRTFVFSSARNTSRTIRIFRAA